METAQTKDKTAKDRKIVDPIEYPVIFRPVEREVILFAIRKYPISFVIDSHPRRADIVSMGIKQMGAYYLNHDIYRDSNVALFSKNLTHKIELDANRKNIMASNFFLKFYVSKTNFLTIRPGQLQIINQPSGNKTTIHHLFSMSTSTMIFDPIEVGGVNYYPTATLSLKFNADGMESDFTWVDQILPDMSETLVPISPDDSYGILDVEASVVFRWYGDATRIYEIPSPFDMEPVKFGMRYCISNRGGVFKWGVQATRSGGAIASDLYSTSVLQDFVPDEYHQVFFWGKGERPQDLFLGGVNNLVISDSGLPVQDSSPRAMYVLDNPLEDIHFSSSSSISSSSISSSSISSSSTSSISSSSKSSPSSSSISSSSSSSSTELMSTLSSKSSISSSSISSSSKSSESSLTSTSMSAKLLFDYKFVSEHDEFGNVLDSSDISRTAKVSPSEPVWSLDSEIGGNYSYFANAYGSQYILTTNVTDMNCSKGTISTWMRPHSSVLNRASVLFSMTNSFTYDISEKTEFTIGIDPSNNELFATAVVNGHAMWQMNGPNVTNLIGEWTNVVVLHNGIEPSLYINGIYHPATFVVSVNKSVWFNSLLIGVNRADRLIIAATTRNFQPMYVYGWNGEIGRTRMWNFNMDSQNILSQYQNQLL
jgi:hypothetical protein